MKVLPPASAAAKHRASSTTNVPTPTSSRPSTTSSKACSRELLVDPARSKVWLLAALALALVLCAGSTWARGAHHSRRSSTRSSPPPAAAAPLQQPPGMANNQPHCVERPLVVLFGDSLTQYSFDPDGGWGAALAHHFQRKVDVVNRGFGGYNTRWGRKLFEQTLAQLAGRRVVLLTLWFGANDAAIPGRSAERQHVPLAEYRANLAAMVGAARQAGIDNILLLTPPPVGDEGRVKHQQMRMGITSPVPPDRTLEYAGQYAQAVRDLGGTLALPVVDVYRRLQAAPGWREELLADGLHLTPAGSRAVWEALREVLAEQLPQLSLEALPNQWPWWDRLDADNFEAYWDGLVAQAQAQQQDGGARE